MNQRIRCSASLLFLFVILLSSCARVEIRDSLAPVPAARDTDQDGHPDLWTFDTNSDGVDDFREIDANFDGIIDRFEYDSDFDGQFDRTLTKNPSDHGIKKKLIICVDSVPHRSFVKLWDEGYFREFARPSKVISSFPSLSNPAFTEILKTPEMPGYEDAYFDSSKNRTAGGVWSRLTNHHSLGYHANFDYEAPGKDQGLVYLFPGFFFRKDINDFKEAFDKSDSGNFIGYISSTDAICHKEGEEKLLEKLKLIDRIVREIFYQHPEGVDIVILSDHGNNFTHSTFVPVLEHLKEAGFKPRNNIKDEKSVVIPVYGLVSCFVIYCREEVEREVAEATIELQEVDFAVYVKDGVTHILNQQGEALVSAKAGGHLRYQTLTGDPLGLTPIVEGFRRAGVLDADGFASDNDWFEATADFRYPDIVRRLDKASRNGVENRASVIVSLKNGHYYGKKFFSKFVDLVGTHGDASDASSYGYFTASFHTELPPYLRTDMVDDYIDN